jgi:hypothetical protein
MSTIAPDRPSTEVIRAREFLERLFPHREFAIRLWDGSEIPGADDDRLTLVINSPTSLRRVISLPIELSLGEANLVAESVGFEVRDVENLREHYMYTLRHWATRLESRKDEAIALDGEGMYRLWRIYMGIAAWQFERGEFGVFQSLLQRPSGGPSDLPLTRTDLYT